MTNREKLNSAVKILSVFGIQPKDILLVGSIALDMQGLLPKNRETHDVDLIVRTSSKTWSRLVNVSLDFGCYDMNTYTSNGGIMFNVGDITLNLWKANGSENLNGLKDDISGVWIKRAGDILLKKKSYGRLKDKNDIKEICNILL